MKDNFSTASDLYARYRPTYPQEFYDLVFSLVKEKNCAWDCGTGNGQVAIELAKVFQKVEATDISAQQLQNAFEHNRIIYSVQPAEKTNFPDKCFDLIVVAQAIHWFDFEKFYAEAKRTLKPAGLLVVVGYNRPRINAAVDKVVDDFYKNVIGVYWDKERRYIDENYITIPFPFKEIKAPVLENIYEWDFGHFAGYLGTWSAVKHFIKDKGQDPIETLKDELKSAWGPAETQTVHFPVLLRLGYPG